MSTGLYYEDLAEGRAFETTSRTVSEQDIRVFAELTGDRHPLHLDAAFAAHGPFGRPVAHGMLGLSLAAGLISQLELTRGTLVALVGVTWRFRGPVFPGDEVRVRLRVASRRETSQPDRGLVTLAAEVVNQRGDIVQEGELVEMVQRRP